MTVVEGRQNQVVRIKHKPLLVRLLKHYLRPNKHPPHHLLLNTLTVPLNKLPQLPLVLQLENLQRLRHRQLRVRLLCTLRNLNPHRLRNTVQEWAEIIERTVLFQLEHSSVVACIKKWVPYSIASLRRSTYEMYLSFKSLNWRVSILA